MKFTLDKVLLAFDTALAGYILYHFEVEIVTTVVFLAGFAAIVVRDYGRDRRPLLVETPVPSRRRKERLPLAS